jgi:mannose-1-phosphate guanylyltransferase
MFGLIMAGGGGTRLWPRSRERFPKQMHALISDKPLVQEMAERLCRILGEDRVFIIANSHHAESIEKIMPSMAERILIDPYRRDTAACIGLAAVYLAHLDPVAVLGVFPADHFIGSDQKFGRIVRTAGELAREGHVVTIGIQPVTPETGYGYIEMGDLHRKVSGHKVRKVLRFVEKPDRETAEKYLAAGKYLWNSGMFVWSIPTILESFEKHLPDTYARLMRIAEALDTQYEDEIVDLEYQQMQRISVDFGIMEKLDNILVIPGDFGWNDIGSWATVSDISAKDDNGNAVKAAHIALDTRNCLIFGADRKLVATIGVEDLIVVDTDDALLICRKDRAQDVKKIVDKLKEEKMDSFL